MNGDEKLDRLFQAARLAVLDTTKIEFGFETRLMAQVHQERERVLPWGVWSWRLLPVLASLVLVLGAWAWLVPLPVEADLAQLAPTSETEQTLVAHWTGNATP